MQTCRRAGRFALVEFEPGWYDDAAALSNLTRDCKGPDGKGAALV